MDDTEGGRRQSSECEQAFLAGDETLLVVEDVASLRELVDTMLKSFGYTVFTAASGDEALKLAKAHHGEINLVVADVMMPEMSGTELADMLVKIMPGLKVLLVSGYPREYAINGEDDERYSFLQKPFSGVELGREVRKMLDA